MRHITFATSDMYISAEKCKNSALKWCESSTIYGPPDIGHEFREFNYDIFSQKRGFGYWLWKPYFIYRELLNMIEGEYLIYTDAGIEFVNDPGLLVNGDNVFLFGNNYNHLHWCKGSVIDFLNGDKEDRNQIQASAMIFRKSEESMLLVKSWLMFCQLPGIIDDSNPGNNHPEFQEHRHDQAVLTCITRGYHWWPAMYNGGAFVYDKGEYKDEYPVIFHHHRKRNNEW